jgi:NTP pyrophosphatase (non-canonical NTP hydrolase)
VKFRRTRGTDPGFDRGDEVAAAEAGEMGQRLLDTGRVAQIGEELGEMAVALIFALEKHAVEVEDDRLQDAAQSSNKAVPTRTAVAPSVTAVA